MLQKNLYVTAYKVYAVVPIIGFSILIFQYGSMVFEGLREIPDSRHNALGLFAGIGAFLAYILRDESKRKWTCIVVLNIIVALCTSSRKAMLYLVLPFIIYYLLSARLNVKFLRNIVLIFCGLIIGYYAIMNIPFLYKIMGSGVESILNSIFDDSLAMDASFSWKIT